MAELQATSADGGLLPLTIGGVHVRALAFEHAVSLLPFAQASDEALSAALGMRFPDPGEASADGDARLIWMGRREALLLGRPAPDALGDLAAVVDQSDAWCFVQIEGDGVEDVLARLVPVDLRAAQFPVGRTARSLLGHMHASITRTGPDRFMLAVFRSMAGTLVHDLTRALEASAARR